jgi:predicted PurR-regulated permease PerM
MTSPDSPTPRTPPSHPSTTVPVVSTVPVAKETMVTAGGTSTAPPWNDRIKRIIALICLAVFGLFLWLTVDILPLMVVTLLLAFLINPLVRFNERRLLFWLPRGRRAFAVLLAFLFGILLFMLVLVIVLPVVFSQISSMIEHLPETLQAVSAELQRVLSQPVSFNGQPILVNGQPLVPLDYLQSVTGTDSVSEALSPENFNLSGVLNQVLGSIGGLTGQAFGVVGTTFTIGVNLLLLLVMIFYLGKDGGMFVDSFVSLVPASYQPDTRRLLRELSSIWNAYLRGQLILCLVIGFATFISALALGLPNALILGLVGGILEFLPNIGPVISTALAVIIALVSTSSTLPFLSGPSLALAVLIVWLIIQQLEALFLVPRVMGSNLDLHPFVVIAAIVIGASIAGLLGIILAAPATATIRLFARYIYGKLTGRDSFPTEIDPRTRTQNLMIVRVSRGPLKRLGLWRPRHAAESS